MLTEAAISGKKKVPSLFFPLPKSLSLHISLVTEKDKGEMYFFSEFQPQYNEAENKWINKGFN